MPYDPRGIYSQAVADYQTPRVNAMSAAPYAPFDPSQPHSGPTIERDNGPITLAALNALGLPAMAVEKLRSNPFTGLSMMGADGLDKIGQGNSRGYGDLALAAAIAAGGGALWKHFVGNPSAAAIGRFNAIDSPPPAQGVNPLSNLHIERRYGGQNPDIAQAVVNRVRGDIGTQRMSSQHRYNLEAPEASRRSYVTQQWQGRRDGPMQDAHPFSSGDERGYWAALVRQQLDTP